MRVRRTCADRDADVEHRRAPGLLVRLPRLRLLYRLCRLRRLFSGKSGCLKPSDFNLDETDLKFVAELIGSDAETDVADAETAVWASERLQKQTNDGPLRVRGAVSFAKHGTGFSFH